MLTYIHLISILICIVYCSWYLDMTVSTDFILIQDNFNYRDQFDKFYREIKEKQDYSTVCCIQMMTHLCCQSIIHCLYICVT